MENSKNQRLKDNPSKKIGLALGGGGAKGLAHIGVIRALEKAEIPIDFIAGTSMGAIVGGWYALTGNVCLLDRLAEWLQQRGFFSNEFLKKKKKKIVPQNEVVRELLEIGFRNKKFSDCHIPFAAIATDVASGEEVVLKEGSLVQAISASIALPIAFQPVKIGERLLMDGGLANPVPADIVKQMGADVVIAVDVSSRWLSLPSEDAEDLEKMKDFYSLIPNLFAAMEYQVSRHVLAGNADIVLKPPVRTYSWTDFDEAPGIIASGRLEAENNLKLIRSKTGYRQPRKLTPLEKFFGWLANNKN
jgi:NTE family protein